MQFIASTAYRYHTSFYLCTQTYLIADKCMQSTFLLEASFGLRILSLPASVCVSVCLSVCQSLACPSDNSVLVFFFFLGGGGGGGGQFALTFKVKFNLNVRIYPILSLSGP